MTLAPPADPPDQAADGTVGSGDPAGRSPGRPRDERVTATILETASRQLAELGYSAMSIESVASVAGVSRATVYRRFRDKADLVTSAIAADLPPGALEPTSDDPRGDLVRFLERFDQNFGGPCVEVLGTLIGSDAERGALELHRERVIRPRTAYLRAILLAARDRGDVAADLDVDLAVEMLSGSVLARRVCGTPSRDGWAERAVALVWPAGRSPAP